MCRTCNNTYGYADVETPLLRGNGVGAGSAGAGGKGAGKALGGSRSPSGDSEAGSYHSHAEQAASGSHAATSHTTAPSKAKHKGPIVSAVFIVACITAITVLVAILTNALVTAIFPVSDKLNISPDFIAVVLLPVVGNAAELATATMAAQRDNLDLSIAVALGSATQISLFLVPASVLFGWAIDVPMTLDFQPTFALVFFGSVLAVAVLTVDGESHWLKGVVLLGVYGTMAVGMAAAPGAAGVDTSSQARARTRRTPLFRASCLPAAFLVPWQVRPLTLSSGNWTSPFAGELLRRVEEEDCEHQRDDEHGRKADVLSARGWGSAAVRSCGSGMPPRWVVFSSARVHALSGPKQQRLLRCRHALRSAATRRSSRRALAFSSSTRRGAFVLHKNRRIVC